ncbi:MAG: hypothetical protein EOM21_21185 [Gammaproteobacteria bacterium]|nr:hypothetical protein [Gammaproteobacteria bacterium]
MAEKKYPEYVTTDSDMWNSADEAYFFVIKGEAKKLTSMITPIIDNALDSGLLREATQEEIDECLLKEDLDKRIREGRFSIGKTYDETMANYLEWKKHYKPQTKVVKETISVEKIEQELNKPTIPTPINDDIVKNKLDDIKNTGVIKENAPTTISPTENALRQKASIRTDNM